MALTTLADLPWTSLGAASLVAHYQDLVRQNRAPAVVYVSRFLPLGGFHGYTLPHGDLVISPDALSFVLWKGLDAQCTLRHHLARSNIRLVYPRPLRRRPPRSGGGEPAV